MHSIGTFYSTDLKYKILNGFAEFYNAQKFSMKSNFASLYCRYIRDEQDHSFQGDTLRRVKRCIKCGN